MHSVEEASEAGLGQVSIEVARQDEHLCDEDFGDLRRAFVHHHSSGYSDLTGMHPRRPAQPRTLLCVFMQMLLR